jgi:hypothetical protein
LQGIRNPRPECGRIPKNPKKILNRGNELKDVLKTKDLMFLGTKNEPETNSILSPKSADQAQKTGLW